MEPVSTDLAGLTLDDDEIFLLETSPGEHDGLPVLVVEEAGDFTIPPSVHIAGPHFDYETE
jgi:hypothetical protein